MKNDNTQTYVFLPDPILKDERASQVFEWIFEEISSYTSQKPLSWYFKRLLKGLLDVGLIVIVCSSGRFYIDPSVKYANGNKVLQILFGICAPIAISGPNIWATLNITKFVRPERESKKQVLKYKKHLLKVIGSVIIELTLIFAAFISITPFLKISIQDNAKEGIFWNVFWAIDIGVTRFLLQYFGLRGLLRSKTGAYNLTFSTKEEKQTILYMRGRLLNVFKAARKKLVSSNLHERKALLSVRYQSFEEMTLTKSNKVTMGKQLLGQLIDVGVEQLSSDNDMSRCCQKLLNFSCINKLANSSASLIPFLGGVLVLVGLAGLGGKTFEGIGSITQYIPNKIWSYVVQIPSTGFAILPLIYLVWYKGRNVTNSIYNLIANIITGEIWMAAKRNLQLKLYPITTIFLTAIAACICAFSWAMNAEITRECYGEVAGYVLLPFAILTWITFTGSSMLDNVIKPLILNIGRFSCNAETKDTIDLIIDSLDEFTETFTRMPLDGVLSILRFLEANSIIKLLSDRMPKDAFYALLNKVAEANDKHEIVTPNAAYGDSGDEEPVAYQQNASLLGSRERFFGINSRTVSQKVVNVENPIAFAESSLS